MNIQAITESITTVRCDAIIVGLHEGDVALSGVAAEVDRLVNGRLAGFLSSHTDAGKYLTINTIHLCAATGPKLLVVAGIGKQEVLTGERLRTVAGAAIREAQKQEVQSVATFLPGSPIDYQSAAQALVEGLCLGVYRFLHYKSTTSGPAKAIGTIYIVESNTQNSSLLQTAILHGTAVAEAVNLTRDLVNHPANYMTPSKLAWHAQEIATRYGLELTVLDKAEIEQQGMHSLLAVAQGSQEPLKLIVLKYIGNRDSDDLTAFVGKGLTFDSGGISLKPSEGMGAMKDDMGGAAAVLGGIQAIAALKLPVNILGVIPCTENMPSGTALRPGDVIRSMNGKTIEIISTDAEGRLILADALAYARKLGATRVVDLATLTGACVVALGGITSGVVSNDQAWCQTLLSAARAAGEKMWELPAFEEYKEQIKSDIADIKNSGGRPAGAITAALFLANFVEDMPWIHIDIAGTVVCDKESGYNSKGATGVGVRTLVRVAADLA